MLHRLSRCLRGPQLASQPCWPSPPCCKASSTGLNSLHLPTGFTALQPVARHDEGLRLPDFLKATLPIGGGADSSPRYSWFKKGLVRVAKWSPETGQYAIIKGEAVQKLRLSAKDRVLCHQSVLQGAEARPESAHRQQSGRADQSGSKAVVPPPSRSPAAAAPPSWVSSCLRAVHSDFAVISKPAGVYTQGGSDVRPDQTVDFWLPALAKEVHARESRGEGRFQREEGKVQDEARGAATAAAARSGAAVGGPSLPTPSDPGKLRLVHRLDSSVSGLMMLARSRAAAESLGKALAGREGKLQKSYIALVAGRLAADRLLSPHAHAAAGSRAEGDARPSTPDNRVSHAVTTVGNAAPGLLEGFIATKTDTSSSSSSSNGDNGSSSTPSLLALQHLPFSSPNTASKRLQSLLREEGSLRAGTADPDGEGSRITISRFAALPLRLSLGAASREGSTSPGSANTGKIESSSLSPAPASAVPQQLTLLLMQPVTGHKHQLRKHVLELFQGRHSIIGDQRYHGSADPPRMSVRRFVKRLQGLSEGHGEGKALSEAGAGAARGAGAAGAAGGADEEGKGKASQTPEQAILLHAWHLAIPAEALPQAEEGGLQSTAADRAAAAAAVPADTVIHPAMQALLQLVRSRGRDRAKGSRAAVSESWEVLDELPAYFQTTLQHYQLMQEPPTHRHQLP